MCTSGPLGALWNIQEPRKLRTGGGERLYLSGGVAEVWRPEGNMEENEDFNTCFPDSKAAYVLSNVAEVVERILNFLPTKSLLRIAR